MHKIYVENSLFSPAHHPCLTPPLKGKPSEFLDETYATQENSAKLTNQRVRYAFTSNSFSIYVRHILPASKIQHSYSCILLIFYTTDINEQHV